MAESDFAYRTKVGPKAISVYSNKNGMEAVDLTASVEWELDFEARSWGVKGVGVFVRKVDASWVWEDQENEGTRAEPTKLTWTPGAKDGWSVQADSQARTMPFGIYPREISIYMMEKKIVIEF